MTRITSGPIIHHPTYPLRVLGGDPGATTGLVLVEFRTRQRDGRPLWANAILYAATTVSKPTAAGATAAEIDILFRRDLITALKHLDDNRTLHGESIADIVAMEEPFDGMAKWAGNQRKTPGGEQIEQRGSGFRLGAHYGALVAAAATAIQANRYISFPGQTRGDRRGWMPRRTKREHILAASDALLRGICGQFVSYVGLQRGKKQAIPEHILMALGVVNHLVENYLDYFPQEK